MCRADVAPNAAPLLVEIMLRIRGILAAEYGEDPETVLIGPVDFGTE
jgi:hypothetical protein